MSSIIINMYFEWITNKFMLTNNICDAYKIVRETKNLRQHYNLLLMNNNNFSNTFDYVLYVKNMF